VHWQVGSYSKLKRTEGASSSREIADTSGERGRERYKLGSDTGTIGVR